jgi:hypothetical protein
MKCRLLVRANWKNLVALHLGSSWVISDKNQIRDKGCSYLAKGEWPKLARLYLSIVTLT